MAIIKSFASYQNLSNFGTFVNDQVRTSEYFRITEFKDTFTGGKNGFLIEGSEHLKETTEIKIEILDVTGTPIYYEPGDGIPEYYEGISKIVSVHVYEDTPIGLGKITVLGELKTYIDENGVVRDIPAEWRGVYNIKWERTFNVNKNLANETIVRFYQRPKITIDEINKPIFNITTPSVTQTGLVEGIPQQPVYGTDIRNWTAGTLYKLKITDGSNWTSSVDENVVNVVINTGRLDKTGNIIYDYYNPTIKEVLNNKEVFVDIPYLISSSVSNFPAGTYTTTFDNIEDQTIINSALTGSFAKIKLSDLKTFVGDVARVKVYRKSRNEVGDYQFIQDTKLESSEILKDITTTATTELSYGQFTESNIKNYWISGSTTHPMTINVDKLNASVKVDYTGTNYDNKALLITSQSLSLTEGVEYTLSFKTLLSGSNDPTKTLKAYFSGSGYPQQTIVSISNSAIYTTKQNVTQNIKATKTGDAKLVFEFAGDDWYLANVSLQNAQETSFSPDEFTLIQDVPRKLASETYDFKFEFYDINNNYIPVDVKTSKTFNGGNSFTTTSKILTFESDRTAFRFSTGSFGNPAFQQVGFKVTRQNLTGSVTYASAAFDSDGNYIVPASYAGTYPGGLTNAGDGGASLTIANFSGSVASVIVGSIAYTASCDGLNEFETIYRFEDGENAPGLFTTSNANQFIYKATDLSLNPSGQVITIEAKRKNLASTTGVIEVNSGSLKPPLTVGATDATSGVSLFTLAGSTYPFSSGATTYSFTGSDQFGNKFSDAITITPVKILDGLSVSLTNENASLPALSTGFVASGSFVLTSGSVSVKVGNESITHNNGLSTNNRFDIVSAIATGVNTGSSPNSNYLDYSTTNYWITQLNADSGSLELRVRYKDGAGDTTDVTRFVTYTKNKKAAPVLSFVIGNNNQTVTAKSTGAQLDAFVTASLSVIETYEGVSSTKTLASAPEATTTNSYIIGNKTTTTIALPTIADATDSVDISVTGSVVDSENTTRNVFGNISLAKSKKAAPVIVATLSKDGQSVTKTNAGVYAAPATFTISVNEGSTNYTYDDSVPYSDSTFRITSISGGSGTTTITPTTPTTDAGTTVAITITYVNSEGTTGTITKEHKVNVTINGNNGTNGTNGDPGAPGATGVTGPGVVHTGVWTNGRQYQFANGLTDNANGATGRRDTVLWSTTGNAPYNTYYATTRGHLSATGNGINGEPHQAAQTGWTSLGTQDFFVAAKIGIFEQSFIQNTLNIGTAATTVNAANITLAGGSAYPYISIGQSSTAGSQGYDVNGIFIGVVNDSGTKYKMSLKSATNSLKWDGTNLTINGGGAFSGDISAATGTFTGGVSGTGYTLNNSGLNLTNASSVISLGNTVVLRSNGLVGTGFSLTTAGVVATQGTIGGWTIETDKLSSPLVGGVRRLEFKPTPLIAINNAAGVPKLTIKSGPLSTIGGAGSVTLPLNSPNINMNAFADSTAQASGQRIYGTGNSFNVSNSGTYSGFVGYGATGTLATPPGGFDGYLYIGMGIQIATDSAFNNIVTEEVIASSNGQAISAGSKAFSVAFSQTGTHYIRVYWTRTLFGDTTAHTSFTSAASTFTNSTLGQSVLITELTDEGFQVINSTNVYLRIQREGTYTTTPFVQVGGTLSATGNIIAYYSDSRLKNIEGKIDNPLEKLDKINGVYYRQNELAKEFGYNNNKRQVGLIAQEVEEVLPEVIQMAPFDINEKDGTSKTGENYLTIDYNKIVPLLVEAIKELKKEIEELKKSK